MNIFVVISLVLVGLMTLYNMHLMIKEGSPMSTKTIYHSVWACAGWVVLIVILSTCD